MKAVVISGDRYALTDKWSVVVEKVIYSIAHAEANLVIVHGDARGIDTIAHDAGRKRRCSIVPMPAQWNSVGRSAGPIRNAVMLVVLNALYQHGYDVAVHCFHDNIGMSRGTRDMHNKAIESGIDTFVWTSNGTMTRATEKVR